jgi:hypothetical protein
MFPVLALMLCNINLKFQNNICFFILPNVNNILVNKVLMKIIYKNALFAVQLRMKWNCNIILTGQIKKKIQKRRTAKEKRNLSVSNLLLNDVREVYVKGALCHIIERNVYTWRRYSDCMEVKDVQCF